MSWFIGKDPDAEKDWRQEEKGITEDDERLLVNDKTLGFLSSGGDEY